MKEARVSSRRSESGAALILALVFILCVGAVLVPLVSLAGTNMLNTNNLRQQRSVEFSADAAMDGAIETVRHEAPTTSCPTFPTASPSTVSVDGVKLVVQCVEAPPSVLDPFGRNVEFDACVAVAGVPFSTCQSRAIVRAEVSFCDLAGTGCTTGDTTTGISYGTQMSVWSWVVRPANA